MNKFYLSSLLAVLVLALIAWVGSMGLPWLFGIVIPYLAVILFIVGVVRRVMGWARSTVPYAIPTTGGQQKSLPWIEPARFDNPSSKFGVFVRMALEVLTFRSLFRNTRMKLNAEGRFSYRQEIFLWVGALAFHYAFLVTIIRHLRFFSEPVLMPVQLLEAADSFFQIEILYSFIQFGLPGVYLSGLVLLAATAFLFLRRLFIGHVRYISLASDYFPLFLIMGIALTGILMRYFLQADIAAIKELSMGLVTFNPSIPAADITPLFYIHLFFVSVLLIYFPYSKLMHLGGIFLSPTRNMRANTREVRHINPWNYPVKVHTYEAYEDEFREKMVEAGLPVEKMPAPASAAATEEEEKE